MKTVLCFGDSNTFGYDPSSGGRFPPKLRWPGILKDVLGEGWSVVEEGLNHRTSGSDDPERVGRNGRTYLQPCLESHQPLDLVIVMLGSNDMKAQYGLSPEAISQRIGDLIDLVRSLDCGPQGRDPEVLVLPPPLPGKLSEYAQMYRDIEEKAPVLPGLYRELASEKSARFLDTSDVRCPDIDGIHLSEMEHQRLGRRVAEYVQGLFRA
ncbi:MAG: SGNH/GDSL hydrolase family protein [bacterium]|nr:SGNH/GDSL hydrolase family protein [bacterium]